MPDIAQVAVEFPSPQPVSEAVAWVVGAHSGVPQQHAEQIARLVRVCQQIEPVIEVGRSDLVAHVAQGREILDREADRVEHGDLPFVPAPGRK